MRLNLVPQLCVCCRDGFQELAGFPRMAQCPMRAVLAVVALTVNAASAAHRMAQPLGGPALRHIQFDKAG